MPASARAGVTAEVKVSPREAFPKTREAAAETDLAHEAGPETIGLAGEKPEVLDALRHVADAALGAGATTIEAKIEVEADAERFD